MDGIGFGREKNEFAIAARATIRSRSFDRVDRELMDPVFNRAGGSGKAQHVAQARKEHPTDTTRLLHPTPRFATPQA